MYIRYRRDERENVVRKSIKGVKMFPLYKIKNTAKVLKFSVQNVLP